MSIAHSASHAQLNATLQAFTSTDLATLAASAPDNITQWIELLSLEGGTGFNTIIGDLVNLKGSLATGDPLQISGLLQTLSEHTGTLADGANPLFIEKLHQLAQSLSDAARELKLQAKDQA